MTTSPAELVGFLYCDLGGVVRGRFVTEDEAARRMQTGLGWVPANQALTPLGTIAEPNRFGPLGDLRILPDAATRVEVPDAGEAGPLRFYLCDAVEPDGTPWDCCPRVWLQTVLDRFERETGARVVAAFEHEFQLISAAPPATPFSLEGVRREGAFPGLLTAALQAAGAEPETFLPEYGPHQFEVPCRPALGLAAADRSVVVKEVVRDVARGLGRRATFTPLLDPDGGGNGAHLHLSFLGPADERLTYDPAGPGRLSELAGSFAAGVLRHATAMAPLFAASPVSYARFAPHHWAASATALGGGNRETLLRVPGVFTGAGGDPASTHLEFRGTDASASPYLALGAVLLAGLEGVREGLAPPPILEHDPGSLDASALRAYAQRPLPKSLSAALDAMEGDPVVRGWLPEALLETYISVKRAELEGTRHLDAAALCDRYSQIY
jgi:glutamine synthetase